VRLRLDDPTLLPTYRAEPAPDPVIEELLARLAAHASAEGLVAVTSPGLLRLTFTPTLATERRYSTLDVMVSGPELVVAVVAPGSTVQEARIATQCRREDLLDTVAHYIGRLDGKDSADGRALIPQIVAALRAATAPTDCMRRLLVDLDREPPHLVGRPHLVNRANELASSTWARARIEDERLRLMGSRYFHGFAELAAALDAIGEQRPTSVWIETAQHSYQVLLLDGNLVGVICARTDQGKPGWPASTT
jgi:hypothetical protein